MLPARLPNLLINGATGIAVGMATNIPPHNLGEVCTALIKLLENDELGNAQLSRYIKGPDFPTGGQILNSPDEIKAIYKTGSGSIRLRGTWDIGEESRSTKTIYIDSIPYTVDKSQLVAQIGEVIEKRKLPQLVDVKDVSTEDVRIAHRNEERRRREDGDGVPLQAHRDADYLSRQPDVPDSDRESRGRAARAARSEVDPLALPAFPARSRHRAPRARARRAEEAHPPARRLRENLRRARRSAPHRPEVGREGRRGRENHEAVRPRCRADRRDPRAEDLSPGAARDSGHPAGARREAEARAADRRPAEERREPLEARARRARSHSEDLRATRSSTSGAR